LEKAFAKYAGSYSKLAGGVSSYAWTHLTGCEDQEMWDLSLHEGKARKSVVSKEWRQKNPRNFQEIYTESREEEDRTYEDFFMYLRDCDQNNFIMTSTIAPKPSTSRTGSVTTNAARCQMPGSSKRSDGLVEGHAYSILEVRTIPGKDGNKYRLLKMRNPWGDCQEWTGI